jgi:hypothetical protein
MIEALKPTEQVLPASGNEPENMAGSQEAMLPDMPKNRSITLGQADRRSSMSTAESWPPSRLSFHRTIIS